jgi:hypothetical protein
MSLIKGAFGEAFLLVRKHVLILVMCVLLIKICSTFNRLAEGMRRPTTNTLSHNSLNNLLTLCTVFSDLPEMQDIHRHVIANWAALHPGIHPVLFAEVPSNLSRLAEESGWSVWNGTADDVNAMIKHLQRRYDSAFYGFARGDTLYDYSLAATLSAMTSIVSRRQKQYAFFGGSQIANATTTRDMWHPDDVRHLVCESLSGGSSVGFFMMQGNVFPWDAVTPMGPSEEQLGDFVLMMSHYLLIAPVDVSGTVRSVRLMENGHNTTVGPASGVLASCKYLTRSTKHGVVMNRFLERKSPPRFREYQMKALNFIVSNV